MKKELALYKKITDIFVGNLEGENRYLSDAEIMGMVFPNVTPHLGDAYDLILRKVKRSIPVVREGLEVRGYLVISDMKPGNKKDIHGRKIAKDKNDEENFQAELQRRKDRILGITRALNRGIEAAKKSKLIESGDSGLSLPA